MRQNRAARAACACALLMVTATVPQRLEAQATAATPAAELDAIRAAALDYIEGFYQGDSTRLVRSVSPSVYKYGYGLRDGEYVGMQMPYDGFMNFARGVREGRNRPPADAPKGIEILDAQDQTAAVKVTAWWGTDYLLLARENGRWVITHVLWQAVKG